MNHQGLVLTVCLFLISNSHADVTIFPFDGVVTLPSPSAPLQSSVVLSCGIEPPLFVPSTSWVTPQGIIVDANTKNPHYVFNEGLIFHNNHQIMSISLQIDRLSYADSGSYSCVVDITNSMSDIKRAEATVELRLLGQVETKQEPSTGANHMNLTCEMSQYIQPDENLIWINKNGEAIEQSGKYTISFKNGTEHVSQNGGNQRSPSRISTLTVHHPTVCDNGNYVCALVGTPYLTNITLAVAPTDDDILCIPSNELNTVTTQQVTNRSVQVNSAPTCMILFSIMCLYFLSRQ